MKILIQLINLKVQEIPKESRLLLYRARMNDYIDNIETAFRNGKLEDAR